ncbi:predicted protein [Chaetoceros tenuissimus]|uniref:Uncharacterized protein n=1 Tax=Chaetoceros tenuissimus TaxID=426638 RepID=A0AAD3CRZ0_9STRA|nr:predicted protein [Chaetoceros tenuissimus]
MSKDTVGKKRRRIDTAFTEKKDTKGGERCSSRLSSLPTQVLGNCFSFLGKSGHYYFLASVCKDFKVAVDELYGDDRNTSVDSILTSVSTCKHVIDITSGEEHDHIIQDNITQTVFKNERVDIFQHVLRPSLNPSDVNTLRYIVNAIKHKSTEVMRFMISHESVIEFIKVCQNIEDISRQFPTSEHAKFVIRYLSVPCDVSMIKYLMEKGIQFNYRSIPESLIRDNLDTFEYLLDTVSLETMESDVLQMTISKAIQHEKAIDAIRILKGKVNFGYTDLVYSFSFIIHHNGNLDLIELFLKGQCEAIRLNAVKFLLCTCIEKERMDVLSHIFDSSSISSIDLDGCLPFAEARNKLGMIRFIRDLQSR